MSTCPTCGGPDGNHNPPLYDPEGKIVKYLGMQEVCDFIKGKAARPFDDKWDKVEDDEGNYIWSANEAETLRRFEAEQSSRSGARTDIGTGGEGNAVYPACAECGRSVADDNPGNRSSRPDGTDMSTCPKCGRLNAEHKVPVYDKDDNVKMELPPQEVGAWAQGTKLRRFDEKWDKMIDEESGDYMWVSTAEESQRRWEADFGPIVGEEAQAGQDDTWPSRDAGSSRERRPDSSEARSETRREGGGERRRNVDLDEIGEGLGFEF